MAVSVSLTDREVEMILHVCSEYLEVFGEAEGTNEYTRYMMDTGLCSAIRKIGKGRNAENVYAKYKTVRTYPTFEEWEVSKGIADSEVE